MLTAVQHLVNMLKINILSRVDFMVCELDLSFLQSLLKQVPTFPGQREEALGLCLNSYLKSTSLKRFKWQCFVFLSIKLYVGLSHSTNINWILL